MENRKMKARGTRSIVLCERVVAKLEIFRGLILF